MNKDIGIYKITNLLNNKIYIGQSVRMPKRMKNHLSLLKNNKHPNTHLQNSFNKYGEEHFVFEVIEDNLNKEKLTIRENYWIDYYNSSNDKFGYNLLEPSINIGRQSLNEKTKCKIRDALIGKYEYSKEYLINVLLSFYEENDKIPTRNDINKNKNYPENGMPSWYVYKKFFNSLNNAILELGYNIETYNAIRKSDKELIEDLRELQQELGRTPNSKDVNKCNYCCNFGVYKDRFGSFQNAFDLAGIKRNRMAREYSDSEIVDLWVNLKEKLGRKPKTKEMVKVSNVNLHVTILSRWGSYSSFLELFDGCEARNEREV